MAEKKYKIRINAERVLGPLDHARISALVMKGQIKGEEPTSLDPFTQWQPFTSFPDLAELILKKLEKDQEAIIRRGEKTSEPATKTIAQPEATRTKTIANTENIEKEEISYGIPTLLNIKAPEKSENPDLERTRIDLPVPSGEENEGTKILTTEKMERALQPFTAPEHRKYNTDGTPYVYKPQKALFGLGKAIKEEDYIDENTGKRRILTRNTAAILAIGILLIAYLNTNYGTDDAPKKEVEEIVPRYFTFPYVEVNNPPRLGNEFKLEESALLVEKGQALIENENPESYIQAIKKYFYPAVGKNIKNYDARALLASSYIRISEVIPRDERLFNTLDHLLFPPPPNAQWTPEYVTARAEYFALLNRFDQAQEVLDAYIKIRPTPELFYQKAKMAFERRDIDLALTSISKTIPPEAVSKANPRHLLFYAFLLDRKSQKDACAEALKRLLKESPNYGAGLLFMADYNFRNGKAKVARNILPFLINRPQLLDRVQLADAFVVSAKIFETLGDFRNALLFANSAEKIHYDKDLTTDLIIRIKSKIKNTSDPYISFIAARQKEKAKQTELAINYYVKGIEANRLDPMGYLLLASLFEQDGQIYEAIDRYKKAKNTPKKPVEAALHLARIYIERFELENAKENLNYATSAKAKADEIAYLRGLMQIKSRRPDIAETNFNQALRGRSRLVPLYLQMGNIETERNNQKLAEFYFSTALRYDPFNPRATLGVALARFHLDSPSRAISFLKDKLAAQPNSAAIMTNLAVIYLRSGDQESGKTNLQNAIKSDPRYAEAFRLLGNLTKEEGDRQTDNYAARRQSYRYALASYEMYSKLAPSDPLGYKATGDLYFDIRDLGAAAKNYYKVIELTPNFPDVRLKLAQISRNGGDATKAMTLIDEEIKINPRSDAALVEKGNIYMAQKDFLSATKTYTEAARLNEKNADALFGLGVVYHLQSGYDNALSLFNRVIKLDPLKADVHWQMGLIYQKQNNRAKAIQSFTNYKGTIRDPALATRADEKIRELSK